MIRRTAVALAAVAQLMLLPLVAHGDELARGIAAIEAGQGSQAAAILKPLAAAGNARAQLHLGMLYYNGHGVAEDEKQAVDLLRRSADSGNVDAMYQLGNVFTFGQQATNLVDDPDLEAAKWYHQAAVGGNRDAQYSLGLMFMSGKGVVKDAKEATYWMQQAAKAGHPDAKSYISGSR